ncbi:hypothetical protein R0I01_01570 [Bacillus pumilus]|nr:hypothetical protein R0I01_01570 [Bacillus pumilus]
MQNKRLKKAFDPARLKEKLVIEKKTMKATKAIPNQFQESSKSSRQ